MSRVLSRFAVASGFVLMAAVVTATPASADTFAGIVGVQSGKCLSVKRWGTADNEAIRIWRCDDPTPAAQSSKPWELVDKGDGYVEIRNVKSGKCVDVYEASRKRGEVVRQYTCNNAVNQRWERQEVRPGKYQFKAKHSGMCADVREGGTGDGTLVVQWTCTGADNQLWTLNR
jgi:hypothetical protein